MTIVRRTVAWVKDDPFGVELAEVDLHHDRLTARGVAIGSDPAPYRLDYELDTTAGFVTSRLHVTSRGEGWSRELELRRSTDGEWSITATGDGREDFPPAGGDETTLATALDCDLGLSPVTNTMPILRHRLHDGGGPVEFTMAWVAVPELAVHADGQRYSHVGPHVVRFEAVDGSFAADIAVDDEGLVVDYPGIARRLRPSLG